MLLGPRPRRHGALSFAAAGVLAVASSGCIPPFGPFMGFPPMSEQELLVENATDDNWVLRVTTDGFPVDFAVPANGLGVAHPYPGTLDEISLLTVDCEEVASLELTDAPVGVRIGPGGRLARTDDLDDAPDDTLVEYFECMGPGFGMEPSAGEPLPDAPGRLIVMGGDGRPWLVEPATAGLEPLLEASPQTFDVEHVVSPDGTRVAFTRSDIEAVRASLVVAALDGSGEEILADNAGSPAWSPDGTRIAYLDLDPFSGGATLSVIAADGGEPLRLAEDASAPRWSPDGRRIAYIAGVAWAIGEPISTELHVIGADGSDPRMLAEAAPFADRPAWSPDGTRIAFVSGDESTTAVSVISVDGGDPTVVGDPGGAWVTEPTWSPDGERIAFAAESTSLFSSVGWLGVVDASGGEASVVGEASDAYHINPVWSPDGRWLAVARSAGMAAELDLVVLDADSGVETVVASGVSGIAAWSE